MKQLNLDILILGGGHAGLEAAHIASQFNLRVGIISLSEVPLASTPCNPSIGGVGKGQVVREIDALGGLMGKVADLSGLQYRVLNESKGYAVQSTRLQVDKIEYEKSAEKIISKIDNIQVVRDRVQKVLKLEEGFLVQSRNFEIKTQKLIVTTGTFLAGKLHIGEEQEIGGRFEAEASPGLNDLFENIQKLKKRFKTGTPPRINADSIDFSKCTPQYSDPETLNFHWNHSPRKRYIEQLPCYLTRTNEKTLSKIRENKERSPIFNGQIQAVGPRYCPSIEDKAFRYPDRNTHHVFIEPESHSLTSYYPNGISTSLPKEIQLEFLRTIEGLENAEIEIYGYAVEYDVVDTSRLDQTLQYQDMKGLYFAGQINGTSGYEEAAGQGLIAGANAALSFLGKSPLILSRHDSYIGVMVEDLVSNVRDEPYRLFSARAENRLFIRDDNAYLRMASYRLDMGLNLGIDHFLKRYNDEFEFLDDFLEDIPLSRNSKLLESYKHDERIKHILKKPTVDPVEILEEIIGELGISIHPSVMRSFAITEKYKGYINRSNKDIERLKKYDGRKIDWEELVGSPNISFECKTRIKESRPETFSQLKRIEGIRPATVVFVANNIL